MDSMFESGSPESGTPIPPVNADDLKRVCHLMAIADHGLRGCIAPICAPGADVDAVFFRAALLQFLFQSGVLDDWREGSEPAELVFHVGAVAPFKLGVQAFDPADFIERLRSEEP